MTTPAPNIRNHGVFRKLLSGSAMGGLLKISGAGIGFLFFAALARLLPPQEYGLFAVGMSTATIIASVASLGQEFSILRFWPAIDEQHGASAAKAALAQSACLVALGSGLVILAAIILLMTNLRIPSLGFQSSSVLVIALLGCCIAFSEFSASALRARGSVLNALLPRDVFWRIIVVVIAFAVSLQSGVGALMVSAIVLGLLVVLQARHFKDGSRSPANVASSTVPADVRRQMRRALPGLWGISVANAIGQHTATIAIGVVLGPIAAASFFAASRLSQLMSMFLLAVIQVFGPLLSRSWHAGRGQEVKMLYFGATAISFLGALTAFVAYVFWGKAFLALFGDGYQSAYSILIILSIGQLINTAAGPNRAFLMMVGKERPLFVLVTVTSLLLPLALPFAASRYGAEGVAVTVTASMALLNIGALVTLATNKFPKPAKTFDDANGAKK